MAKAPEHIPRLLALVRALSRRKPHELPVARLCEELGISEEELKDDIRLLSMCGLPPYGPDNLIDIHIVRDRVRLSNRVLTPPPLQLSDEEAAGLRLTLRLAEAQGWPETKALSSAIRKLEGALLPERREGGRRLARKVLVAKEDAARQRWLPLVRKAIEKRFSLDVDYYSDGREELTHRRLDPYRLVALPRDIYVIAHCHLRDAVQTFRLDRIVRARRTTNRFEPPAEVRVEDYLGVRPRDADRQVAVTVRFAPEQAWVALETWPEAKPTQDGGALLRTRIWPSLAFCREIVAWGGAAEVLEPESVRVMVRDYARSVAEKYAPASAGEAGASPAGGAAGAPTGAKAGGGS
jgi:proteasome accessory factor C